MSFIPIDDAASATRKVDVFLRTEGPDTVEMQAIAVVNPSTGNPLLPTAGGDMPVTGTVALDGATLAALESINANTGGLTNAELRAAAVPVSGPLTNTELRAAAIATIEAATTLTGAAAQTAVVNNILESPSGATGTTVDNLRSASVQVVSTGTGGTFIFEQSNDGASWIALPVYNAALVTGVPITAAITATASQIIYTFPIRCRFVRLRIATLITGGSIQAFSRFSTEPWTPTVATVAQPTAANLQATVAGTVTANVAASTNLIGDVGLQVRANATGAASIHHIVSAATTNVAQIKATAGRVLGWSLSNNTASWRYVKLHNVASATAGAAVTMTIGLPPNATVTHEVPAGIGFATAISRSIVAGAADADATAIGANEVVGDIFFA